MKSAVCHTDVIGYNILASPLKNVAQIKVMKINQPYWKEKISLKNQHVRREIAK